MGLLSKSKFSITGNCYNETRQIEISLHHTDRLEEDALSFWEELLNHFSIVVNHGGLSGNVYEPQVSQWELTEFSQLTDRNLKACLSVRSIDPGAWRVFINLICASSEASYALSHFEITDLNESTKRKNLDDVMELPYPEFYRDLPFNLIIETASSDSRLIQIEFLSPLGTNREEDIIRALLSWDNICLGGYPEDNEPPISNANNAIEAYMIAPHIVQHPIPNYAGSELAFNCIVAMAHWFHNTGSPVESVFIE